MKRRQKERKGEKEQEHTKQQFKPSSITASDWTNLFQ